MLTARQLSRCRPLITVALIKLEDEKLCVCFQQSWIFLVVGEILNEYDVSVTSLGNRQWSIIATTERQSDTEERSPNNPQAEVLQ